MEIKTSENICILTPLTPKLDERECLRLFDEMCEHSSLQIGLDLSFVDDCTIDFIELLKSFNDISLFNISSNIFTLFNLMNVDKCINLFVTEEDFKNNKRRVLNRRFSVV